MTSTVLPVSLSLTKDKDILSWWEKLPNYRRSAEARLALRNYIQGQRAEVQLIDIYNLILEMKKHGVITVVSQEEIGRRKEEGLPDLPEDIAAALDKLGG